MIRLVTGAIGSGKTSYCVGLVVEHLAKGGTVFTNIDLNFPAIEALIRKRNRRVIVQSQIRRVDLAEDKGWNKLIEWGVPGFPVLVLWDEIHLFFNSRDWSKTQKLHADMLSFLSQSRKACVDIVFIAQVASTLEKQFRDQCELEFFCRNMKTVKIPILGTLPLNKMLLVERDKNTDKAISRQLVSYDRGIWGCYDTFSFLDASMRESSDSVVRVAPMKLQRVPTFSLGTWVAMAVAAVLCVVYYLAYHPF